VTADASQRIVISVQDLDLEYGSVQSLSLIKLKDWLKRAGDSDQEGKPFQALKGVSFEVREGEKVALLGLNGAGKTSLMRVLIGELSPSGGSVEVAHPPALFSAGGALLKTSTGRANLKLACLAREFSPDQIENSLPLLVERTGLGKAIDRNVGEYSSGMKARLRFVIATMERPQILLIDEGFRAGDKKFKNDGKAIIGELLTSSLTLIMSSHNISDLKTYCSRGILIEDGSVVIDGDLKSVLSAYELS